MTSLNPTELLELILVYYLSVQPTALKRSFDIDDVDDIPSFSSASPTASPTSPTSSSSHLLLSSNKTNEGRGVGVTQQSSSAAFNNNNNTTPYHSHLSRTGLGSGSGPVLKSRSVTSSLSFNHGSMNKPMFKSNGNGVGGVIRAASFQNRFNPNGYYSSMLSGPGSDNDSLHSSSSSLEYSGVGVPHTTTMTKYGNSYTSHPPTPPLGEYQHHHLDQPQSLIQGGGGSLVGSHSLKNVSSHGSIFHSEHEDAPGLVLGCVPELRGISHGSMPSLDLQLGDRGGGGREIAEREGGGTPLGLRFANTNRNWNDRLHHSSATGIDVYSSSNNQNRSHHQSATGMQSPPPGRAKEPPKNRLNKFPLDLENLDINTAATKSEAGGPKPPKPPPRSTGSTPQYSTSPSASLSSLESNSDTSPLSLHHPLSPFPQLSSPTTSSSRGSIPIPGVSRSPMPLSPAQTPQLQVLSGPQVVHVVGTGTGTPASPHRASAAVVKLPEEAQDKARDSVGSILQRIASFSRPAAPGGISGAVGAVSPKPCRAFSNGLTRDGGMSLGLPCREGTAEARVDGASFTAPRQRKKNLEGKANHTCSIIHSSHSQNNSNILFKYYGSVVDEPLLWKR